MLVIDSCHRCVGAFRVRRVEGVVHSGVSARFVRGTCSASVVVHLLHRCRWLLVMMLLRRCGRRRRLRCWLLLLWLLLLLLWCCRCLCRSNGRIGGGRRMVRLLLVLRCLRPVIFDYAYARATITGIRLAAIAVGRFVTRGRGGSGDGFCLLRRHRRWLCSLGGWRRRGGYLSR
jgi:hypothetical protein